MAIRRLSRPTLTTLTKLSDAREASWTRPRRDMQGCGGRRRIALVGVLLLYRIRCPVPPANSTNRKERAE